MNDYFGYVRVSTAKQGEGVSLDAQKEAIEVYAASHDLNISRWFEEKETAAKAGRPIFGAMVKSLRKRDAVGIVIHKIDRSARNIRDWARIGELADEGFDIRFATESLDFQSRGGRLSADIQAVIAADFIRNLREETRKGIQGRLKQGLYPFGAPIGYLNNGQGKPKTPDPARAPLVQEMFRLYSSGTYSLRSLRIEMTHRGLTNKRGNRPSKKLIEKALSNPFYCGVIRIRTTGETYQGIHEPIISAAVFERVQAIKSGKCGKKINRHNHVFRGLFRCGHCQYAMIPERQKGCVYYRCHTKECSTTSVREDQIDAAVLDSLQSLTLTDEAREALVTAARTWIDARIRESNDARDHQDELDTIDERLDRLTDALIDRTIDAEIYARHKERLLLGKSALRQQEAATRDLLAAPTNVRKFLELAKDLPGLYQTLEKTERRRFVQAVTSNRQVLGRKLQLEPSEWLQVIPDVRSVSSGAPSGPETRTAHGPKKGVMIRLIEASVSEDQALIKEIVASSAPGNRCSDFSNHPVQKHPENRPGSS